MTKSIPQSKSDIDGWFSMIVIDEISMLRRHYEAIRKWEKMVGTELDEFRQEVEKRRTPQWDEYGYDPCSEEAFMLFNTQRVMFANLAVSIAATAENFVIRICKTKGFTCTNAKGETDFNLACNSLGRAWAVVITELSGYAGNQRARLLGNCFKHCEGKTNDRFVKKFGGIAGEEIKYEDEDWSSMISDTQKCLEAITAKMNSKQVAVTVSGEETNAGHL